MTSNSRCNCSYWSPTLFKWITWNACRWKRMGFGHLLMPAILILLKPVFLLARHSQASWAWYLEFCLWNVLNFQHCNRAKCSSGVLQFILCEAVLKDNPETEAGTKGSGKITLYQCRITFILKDTALVAKGIDSEYLQFPFCCYFENYVTCFILLAPDD